MFHDGVEKRYISMENHIGLIYLKFGVHEELIEGLTGGPILSVILTGVGGPGVLFEKKV